MKPDGTTGRTSRLGADALVVAYAMSRLDRSLLDELGYRTWTTAFAETSAILGVPHNSIKLLRDPHPSRLALLREFEHVSDAALVEVVRRVLKHDAASLAEIVSLVTAPAMGVAKVAERLLTGRRAEEFFIASCEDIIGVPAGSLQDWRNRACGFDFATKRLPGVALEIKGIRESFGGILFTERESMEAKARRHDYWVVLVGNTVSAPVARVFPDPAMAFDAKSQVIRTPRTVWGAQVTINSF